MKRSALRRSGALTRRKRLRPLSKQARRRLPERRQTREDVISRDEGRCRVCRAYVGATGHVHEIVYRSQGGDPYDPDNCVLVCPSCHADEHAHRIRLTGTASALAIRRGEAGQ